MKNELGKIEKIAGRGKLASFCRQNLTRGWTIPVQSYDIFMAMNN